MAASRIRGRDPLLRGLIPRLLLACLLAALPLLGPAGIAPADPTPADGASAIGQMPCHSEGSGAVHDPAAKPDLPCPHCEGDGPLSACQCCGQAAPAKLAAAAVIPVRAHATLILPAIVSSGSLPQSTPGRLFRPPILHA